MWRFWIGYLAGFFTPAVLYGVLFLVCVLKSPKRRLEEKRFT
jgi:hypothetical protein